VDEERIRPVGDFLQLESVLFKFPSMLQHGWFDDWKGIKPVKKIFILK